MAEVVLYHHAQGLTDGVQAFAAERNLTLFYDACHAIGCTHRGRRIGGFGSGEVFSYHATQVLNAAEGGRITTNDPRLADRLRTMRNFSPGQTFASVPTRINGKMSEAQAALALLSLEDLPDNIAANCARHDWYAAGLAEIPGVDLVRYPDGEDSNFQHVVIEIDADRSGIDRDIVFELLAAENVLCRRHFAPGLRVATVHDHRLRRRDDGEHAARPVHVRDHAAHAQCRPVGCIQNGGARGGDRSGSGGRCLLALEAASHAR